MRKNIKKVEKPLPVNKEKELNLRPMFPNMLTMSALACGLTSIQFAFWANWRMAVVCILLAAFFDGIDGRVARLLNVSSKFGAELDSLSDLVCFGVAPGFLLYRWTMNADAVNLAQKTRDAIGVHWGLALFLALCCAWRLARFNTMLDEKQPPYWAHFFTGLPAPAGAYLALFPLILALAFNADGCTDCFMRCPFVVGSFMFLSAFLMASKVPTPCVKKFHILSSLKESSYLGIIMAGFIGLLAIGLWINAWIVISILGVFYLVSLPLGLVYFLNEKRKYENK